MADGQSLPVDDSLSGQSKKTTLNFMITVSGATQNDNRSRLDGCANVRWLLMCIYHFRPGGFLFSTLPMMSPALMPMPNIRLDFVCHFPTGVDNHCYLMPLPSLENVDFVFCSYCLNHFHSLLLGIDGITKRYLSSHGQGLCYFHHENLADMNMIKTPGYASGYFTGSFEAQF